jgi:hypothetical protein
MSKLHSCLPVARAAPPVLLRQPARRRSDIDHSCLFGMPAGGDARFA